MKTNQLVKALLVLLLFQFTQIQAQDDYQMFWVHEDRVKPAKIADYEGSVKDLVAALEEHKIEDVNWITMATSDFRYAFVSPIDNMAEMDKNAFLPLAEKMGREAFGDLFSRMDACYNDHIDYILTLDPSLSYMPDGMTQTPEGENYRENGIYYFSPANYGKALEIAKKFKDLYTEKGSKLHYRVYRSGFGTDGTYLMVAVAAKDAGDLEAKSKANEALLGDELNALRAEILEVMESSKEMKGWVRKDLAYSAKANK